MRSILGLYFYTETRLWVILFSLNWDVYVVTIMYINTKTHHALMIIWLDNAE